jgi:hypothetical protein
MDSDPATAVNLRQNVAFNVDLLIETVLYLQKSPLTLDVEVLELYCPT